MLLAVSRVRVCVRGAWCLWIYGSVWLVLACFFSGAAGVPAAEGVWRERTGLDSSVVRSASNFRSKKWKADVMESALAVLHLSAADMR